MKRIIAAISALAVMAGLAVMPAEAQAASRKKSVYVISSISVTEDGKTTSIKPTYTKDGLFKKIKWNYADASVTDSFTYETKGRIKQYTEEILTGSHKGEGATTMYTWEGSRLTKKTEYYGEGESSTTEYTHNSKGQIISSSHDFEGYVAYAYKKGHVIKSEGGKIKYSAVLDSKGNVKEWTRTFDDQIIGYYNAKITYKSGRVKKLTRTFKANPMQEREQKQTFKFKYKKKKVSKSLAKKIAEQQWRLINDTADSFAW